MRSAHPTQAATAAAQFPTREGAELALRALADAGVPRDLVVFAVNQEGAVRHFAGKVDGRGSAMLENAAHGAWIGLVISGLLSLLIVWWPAPDRPEALALVQLLGPNMGVMAGALIGILWAWIVPPRPFMSGVPVPEGSMIVVSIHGLDSERADRALQILESVGGARLPVVQSDDAL